MGVYFSALEIKIKRELFTDINVYSSVSFFLKRDTCCAENRQEASMYFYCCKYTMVLVQWLKSWFS